VRDQTVGGWLDELASSAPAPGGGAAGALSAATAAALVEMVCSLSEGKPAAAGHEETLRTAHARATELRARALDLAGEDAAVFTAVIEAYRLPKSDDTEKAARTRAIQAALAGAARVPLDTAGVAAEVVRLAGRVLDGANPNVLSDVAVAAAAARAALDASVVNVEVNLAMIKDAAARDELAGALAPLADGPRAEADRLVAAVLDRIRA
jgi:formiminotetrahydrofolate cyclodeaminase